MKLYLQLISLLAHMLEDQNIGSIGNVRRVLSKEYPELLGIYEAALQVKEGKKNE